MSQAISPDDPPVHPKRIENPNQAFIYVGDKKLKKLQKRAWDANWWPKTTKSGIMWFAPERGQVTIHGSESDHHAYANTLARFRAAGLDV
jgi:hypothetical protein